MVNPSLLGADNDSMSAPHHILLPSRVAFCLKPTGAPPLAVDVEPEMFNAADDALALLEGQEPASEKTDTDFFNSFDDDFDDEDVA